MTDEPLSEAHSRSARRGSEYERMVAQALEDSGWTEVIRHPAVGDELNLKPDFEATDPNGVRWWIECKTYSDLENGKLHGSAVVTASWEAAVLKTLPDPHPYMLVLEQRPMGGTDAARLALAEREGWIDEVQEIATPRLYPMRRADS